MVKTCFFGLTVYTAERRTMERKMSKITRSMNTSETIGNSSNKTIREIRRKENLRGANGRKGFSAIRFSNQPLQHGSGRSGDTAGPARGCGDTRHAGTVAALVPLRKSDAIPLQRSLKAISGLSILGSRSRSKYQLRSEPSSLSATCPANPAPAPSKKLKAACTPSFLRASTSSGNCAVAAISPG